MTTIIPRWEWRTFGRQFGAAEAQFVALRPTGVQESDELYLLSEAGDNVKVRADVILAGACVVRTVMEKLGQDSLTVSDRGLRHGLLVERFGA